MAENHASDCAVHNAPAFEPGPCDCAPMDKLVLPTGYTPGDWYGGVRGDNLIVQGEATECIAVIPSPIADGHGLTSAEERGANMELLALAPAMASEITALREERDRLKEALERFATHGIPNMDLTPTRLIDPSNEMHIASEDWWQNWLFRANENVKQSARAALTSTGDPIPSAAPGS